MPDEGDDGRGGVMVEPISIPAENEIPTEPSSDQCNAKARGLWGSRPVMALWYPQMGGYVGKALVVEEGDCFNTWVWHDGEFPFDGEMDRPRELHHCDPAQFILFGDQVSDWQESLRPGDDGREEDRE